MPNFKIQVSFPAFLIKMSYSLFYSHVISNTSLTGELLYAQVTDIISLVVLQGYLILVNLEVSKE